MVFLRISRETPRHNVSRGGQIIPSSLEVAKSYHLYLIKITQPLTSLEELRIIPSLLLSRDQNQTIPTSLEGHNHTIHTSLEGKTHTICGPLLSYITLDPPFGPVQGPKQKHISTALEGHKHNIFTSLEEVKPYHLY